MIKQFNYGKTKEKYLPGLFDFLKNNSEIDFYLTLSNKRIYTRTIKDLKTFFKNSSKTYIYEDGTDCKGIILLWRGFGGDVKRYYVKLNALNVEIAEKLLSILLWNVKEDMYVKLDKKSKFLNIFKTKNFKFIGGRGKQVLLCRKYITKTD